MHFGHLIEEEGEFFEGIFGGAGALVVGAFLEIDQAAICLADFEIFDIQGSAELAEGRAGGNGFLVKFIVFEEVGLSEDEDNAADGVNGHDAGEEEAEVTVYDAHRCYVFVEQKYGMLVQIFS